MALWLCGNEECGTLYSVGAPFCPECRANDPRTDEDDEMAKISKHAGPSDIDSDRLPPHIDEETGARLDRQDAEQVDREHVSWTELGREGLVSGVVAGPESAAHRETVAEQGGGAPTEAGRAPSAPPLDADQLDDGTSGDADVPVQTGAQEFDPNSRSTAEVKAYLKTADATERERVLAAERQGRNRAGVLNA